MKTVQVKSSHIQSVSWEGPKTKDTEPVLRVNYKDGKSYDHPGVSHNTFEQLIASSSIGAFVNSRIRKQFPGTLVRTDPDTEVAFIVVHPDGEIDEVADPGMEKRWEWIEKELGIFVGAPITIAGAKLHSLSLYEPHERTNRRLRGLRGKVIIGKVAKRLPEGDEESADIQGLEKMERAEALAFLEALHPDKL